MIDTSRMTKGQKRKVKRQRKIIMRNSNSEIFASAWGKVEPIVLLRRR